MSIGRIIRRAVSSFSRTRRTPTRTTPTRRRGGSPEAQVAKGVARFAKKKL